MPAQETLAMRHRARSSAQRFTEEAFATQWIIHLEKLIDMQRSTLKH